MILPMGAAYEQADETPIIYKSGDPADWPKNLDAVKAAPDHHKILLENEDVRVLEVTLAQMTIEPLHSHQCSSVLYVMAAGDFLDRDMEENIFSTHANWTLLCHFPSRCGKGPKHHIPSKTQAKT